MLTAKKMLSLSLVIQLLFLETKKRLIRLSAAAPMNVSFLASLLAVIMVAGLLMPLSAGASVKTLRGEVVLEQMYESNPDRVSTGETYDSRSSISPGMIFTRSSQKSRLALRYAPSLIYSYQTEDERVNHRGSGEYEVYMARRLRLNFRDTYVQGDDLYTYTQVREISDGDLEMADRRGRREYWTNQFAGSMNLEYARESFLDVGYANDLLRNREDGFTDFTRHKPFSSLSYRFNQQWGSTLDYSYELIEYDNGFDDDDGDDQRKIHEGGGLLHYKPSPLTRLFMRGVYRRTDYEDSFREYEVYTATVGIDRQLSPFRSVAFESGYSRIKREGFSDKGAVNLKMAVDTTMERGVWRLYGESGTDELYYRGIDKDELSLYWRIGARISHGLTKNISGNAEVYYSEALFIERDESEKQVWYSARTGLSYRFARYYQLSAGYSYTDVDAVYRIDPTGREVDDSYQNHHVFIRLTAGKDLLKW